MNKNKILIELEVPLQEKKYDLFTKKLEQLNS